MSTDPVQSKQPVPLFYGPVSSGDPVTQALTSGFDYVITAIVLANNGDSATYVTIADESSVRILGLGVAGDESGSITDSSWFGEMPIGPRTALNIAVGADSVNVYIGGYALQPETVLSV